MLRTLVLLVTSGVVLCAAPAGAIVIGFVPSDQTVGLGATVGVDLVISDLGDFTAPSLGSFDLDVTYDDAILGAPSVTTLTSLLGDSSQGETIEGVDLSIPGFIDVFLVSLLSPLELDALQPASFVLLTLTFDAIAQGTSALELTEVLLGDALGAELSATAGSGSITVQGPGTGVPEPSLAGLLLTAAVGVFAHRRPRRSRRPADLSTGQADAARFSRNTLG
jgi:hypothetical protein